MKKFSSTPEQRSALKTHHRKFQHALEVVANDKLNIRIDHPRGIFKWEGGVTVNGKEIVIFKDRVRDDWRGHKTDDPTPEETAVAEAIEEIIEGKWDVQLWDDPKLLADPLRSFFE